MQAAKLKKLLKEADERKAQEEKERKAKEDAEKAALADQDTSNNALLTMSQKKAE